MKLDFALFLCLRVAVWRVRRMSGSRRRVIRKCRIWPGALLIRSLSRGRSMTTKTNLVAGKPWVAVVNVSQPTMTVYSPRNYTGVAVVRVFPVEDTRFGY